MDKKIDDLRSIYSDTEKDIANMESELKQLNLKEEKLQQLVACHIAKICPAYFKRVFKENSCLLDPKEKSVEKMFVNQDDLCKEILGYSFSIKNCSFEEIKDKLMKRWEVEGKVGEYSFIVDFLEETGISKDTVIVKDDSSPITIQNLEIFPSSVDMICLADRLKTLNHLKVLISCLHFYQILHKKRDDVIEKLSGYNEITITKENGTIIISVNIENLKFSIHWEILFREHSFKYSEQINFEVDESVVMDDLQGHECLPYLLSKKYLKTSEEIMDFFEKLFHMG